MSVEDIFFFFTVRGVQSVCLSYSSNVILLQKAIVYATLKVIFLTIYYYQYMYSSTRRIQEIKDIKENTVIHSQ